MNINMKSPRMISGEGRDCSRARLKGDGAIVGVERRRTLVSVVEFGWSSRADPHASLMAFFASVFILG